MKTIIYLFILTISGFWMVGCQPKPESKEKESHEAKDAWVSIFNGKNLDDWSVKIKGHPVGENWKQTFLVVDSTLKVDYSQYETFDDAFGHIFYKTPYSDYRLKLKYRFTGEQLEGGQGWAERNSGVMIHSQDPASMNIDQDFPVSIEVQLLGGLDKNVPRSTANLCTPGTHATIDDELVTAHCISSNSDSYYGDQWVALEIEVRHDSLIKHFINGKEVMQYSRPIIGGEFNTLPELEGTPLEKGYISLQSESHPVEFKDIWIMELK
jgi:hypothetical protein